MGRISDTKIFISYLNYLFKKQSQNINYLEDLKNLYMKAQGEWSPTTRHMGSSLAPF